MSATTLAQARSTMRRLTSPAFMQAMGAEAGVVIERLVHRGFDEQKDPYGVPWKPRKMPRDKRGRFRRGRPVHPILHKTGTLEDSIRVKNRFGAGGLVHVDITAGTPYGIHHMTGTRKMPARPFMPVDGDLPPRWEEELRWAAGRVFGRALRR